MKTSTDRILTTHVGSLPRPQEVVDLLFAQDRGEPIDAGPIRTTVMRRAVAEAVAPPGGGRHRYRERRRDEQDQLRHLHPPPADRIRRRFRAPHASGPRRLSGVSRPPGEGRPLGDLQASRLQRPDQGQESRAGAAGYRAHEGRARQGESHRRLHERRLARHDRRVPAERILSVARDLSRGARRTRCAKSTR